MRTCSVFLLLLVGSCTGRSDCGLTGPQSCAAVRQTASSVAGSWRTVSAPSGMSVTLQLSARDTSLAGTGSVISGTTSTTADVRGFVSWRDAATTPAGVAAAHPEIVLDLALAGGGTARLDQGTLRGDTLDAALTFADSPTHTYGLTLVRDRAR